MARIQFQFDEHVSSAVATELRKRGVDVLTSGEAGLVGAPDTIQLAHARAAGRVLFTQDGDFLSLHRQHTHAGIAYCKMGSRSIGQIVEGLMLIYDVYEAEEMTDRVEYL